MPIIAKVISENVGRTEKEVRAALRDAYPFGERKMWPYKVWCAEVNEQLHKPKRVEIDPNQLRLEL